MVDNKIKTGIQGLDKALKGGIPKGNLILISGGAGTGKSTLCMQFLINGAKLFGEKGLYISTEQTEKELYKAAELFGWNLKELEEKNLLQIKYFDVTKGDNYLEKIYEAYTNYEPTRIAIDSLTTLTDALLLSDMSEEKAFSMVQIAESVSPIPRTEQIISKTALYNLISKLKLFGATTLMTSELFEGSDKLSADGVSEFITDGVFEMHYLGIAGADTRTLRIRKLRYSDHIKSYIPYEIKTKEGLVVRPEEAMDVLMK